VPNRHRGFRDSGSRRLTSWFGPADQGYVAVASAGATLFSNVSIEERVTVIRTRGQISIIPAAFGADLNVVGAVGMGIVTTEAFTAGILSVPEPFSDADWGGWLMWRSFSYRVEFLDSTGIAVPNWSFEVDSKAMRKVRQNETIILVAESQQGAFTISAPLRVLVKLS